MTRIATFLILSMIMAGCASGPTNSRGLWSGQWTHPQSVGSDSYLIEGYNTQDALNGAKQHCTELSKNFKMTELIPHTNSSRATITYKCI